MYSFCPGLVLCLLDGHRAGLCGKQKLKKKKAAWKRGQIMGFVPVTNNKLVYLKDPKVYNTSTGDKFYYKVSLNGKKYTYK